LDHSVIGACPDLRLADFVVQIEVLGGEHSIEGLQHLGVHSLADDGHVGWDSSTGGAAPTAWIGSYGVCLRRHQEEDDGPAPRRYHRCSLLCSAAAASAAPAATVESRGAAMMARSMSCCSNWALCLGGVFFRMDHSSCFMRGS